MVQANDLEDVANALRSLRNQLRKASDELRETANVADVAIKRVEDALSATQPVGAREPTD